MVILDILKEQGLSPRKTSDADGGVYASGCPFCREGEDRFVIWPMGVSRHCTGRYWCRKCSKSGDTIDLFVKLKGLSEHEAKVLFYSKKTSGPNTKPIQTALSMNEPPKLWQEKLGALVDLTHKKIWQEKATVQKLERRGIPKEAIESFKIGYNAFKTTYCPQDLGYKEKDRQKDIAIFAGIVIPTFEPSGKLVRLKIRRIDWKPSDSFGKYLAVSGSMRGLNIIGDRKKTNIIVVESELDGYAVAHAAKDKALVIAVGSNTKNPDSFTDFLVKKKDRLIVIYDNDEGGHTMLKKWKGLYEKAEGAAVPVGKDIGEAFEQGYDVKAWLDKLLS